MARRKVEEAAEVEEVLEVELRLADDKLELQWWTEGGIRCKDTLRKGERVQLPAGHVVLVLT